MRIGILRYGVGNIGSLVNAFRRLGVDVTVLGSAMDFQECDGIVFPGVGSFDSAMRFLRGLADHIDRLRGAKPVLGICLGMQLLFDRSEEGVERGLGWLRGSVIRLRGEKVPHIGWNTVEIIRECQIVDGIPSGTYFYFAHSYAVFETDLEHVVGTTAYGDHRFVSVLCDEKQLLYGTQFHPERSSKAGLKLLENFVRICSR